MPINRRNFIKAVGVTAVASRSLVGRAQSDSPNELLRMAVIGFGGRGKSLIGAINASPNAKLVALADVDEKILGNQSKDDSSLFRTDDFRRILERDDIDAIASATPNHWHSLISVLAIQAGKHVYIEKPISHNMQEGRSVVAAAKHYNKIVQCGFQNRSDTGLIEFYANLHNGDYGKVLSVHGTCHRSRASIGKLDKPLEIPKNINYDLWLGPAANQPIMRPSLHYDWHWDFNTGNGDVGNQGPHEWDLMNWALGNPDDLPTRMVSAGNRFAWNDAGNTPNVMACYGMSGDVPIFFEVMDLKPGRKAPHGKGVGVVIRTEKGTFVGGRGGGKFVHQDGTTKKFDRVDRQDGTKAHMQNFVEAVFDGNRSKLRADCAVAANSAAMAHMANISYQMGRESPPEELESEFSDSVQSRDTLARMRESTMLYAAKHGVEELEPWILGASLSFDNGTGQFVGPASKMANQKMTRDYRAGYEFPKIG